MLISCYHLIAAFNVSYFIADVHKKIDAIDGILECPIHSYVKCVV